ncbi:RING finger domain-containing protein, partial [Candidatus Dependentiae bacterium]
SYVSQLYKGIKFNIELFKYPNAYNFVKKRVKIVDSHGKTVIDLIRQISKNYKNPFDTKKCLICLDEFKNTELVSVATCKHAYHLRCILEWFDHKRSCPLCNRKLEEKNLSSKIFLKKLK